MIDDDADLRSEIVEILELSGYGVISAADGLEGLAVAQRERPDLVICDVMLPGLDGFEVAGHLREDRTTAGIPLIFVTGRASTEQVRKGVELGAVDYLTKPFTLAELLAAVERSGLSPQGAA